MKVRDVLYIKNLEQRRLKRPLTEEEMDGEPFWVCFPDGHYEEFQVPYLNFPYDLLSIATEPFEDMFAQSLQDAS